MSNPGSHIIEKVFCHYSNPNSCNYFLEKLGDVISKFSGFESQYDAGVDPSSHCLRNQILGFAAIAITSIICSLGTYAFLERNKRSRRP